MFKHLSYLFLLLSLSVHSAHAIMIIGHRGACGYETENTLASFEKAIELGVDMIELDVWRCASGELVVFHDKFVDKLTDDSGYIIKKSLEEINQLRMQNNHSIPTLKEVFDCVNRRVKIDIELKNRQVTPLVVALIEEYVDQKGWSYDDFLVTSFDHCALHEFKALCPHVKIGTLLSSIPLTLGAFADEINTDVVILNGDCINQAIVTDIHARGKQVFVYTINNPQEIQKMKELGIDGIITNYPDRIIQ